jgi:DNA polymerase (family 10)
MTSNRELRRLFSVYAELLLLHGKDEHLSHLLSGAAFRLRRMNEESMELTRDELLKEFRPQVVKIITELKETNTIEALDELIQLTPAGLFEMMRIKGLGGKKLAILWNKAKIDTLEGLVEACRKDRLLTIPGFGKKSQDNILKSVENYSSNKERFHLASVLDIAISLVASLEKLLPKTMVSLCGEIRRCNNTVGSIEIITTAEPKKIAGAAVKKLLLNQVTNKKITTAQTLDEIPVTIYHTSTKDFQSALFTRTGNDQHVAKVLKKIPAITAFRTEEAIYEAAGLKYILPELREDNAEWEIGNKKLLTVKDIKGVVHNHSTWSDGVDTLDDFVSACAKKKFEYVVISDHSKNAHYAGGLKEEKVLKQMKEIDELNKKMKPFKIFKSIECDILISGELDYDKALLKKFDLVIVSIHQLLKMDEAKSTARLIKAIENPFTTILGHMTGRQLLIRPGYPLLMCGKLSMRVLLMAS